MHLYILYIQYTLIYIYIHTYIIYIYIYIYIYDTLYIIHMAYSNAFSATKIYIQRPPRASVRPPGSGGRLRFAPGQTGRHGLLRRALSGALPEAALPEAALPAWRGANWGGGGMKG